MHSSNNKGRWSEWSSAAIKTSNEILQETRSSNSSILFHGGSVGIRAFLSCLFFWCSIYFIFVRDQKFTENLRSSAGDTISAESVRSSLSSSETSEYDISDNERGHWSVSFIHSFFTVIIAGYLLVRLLFSLYFTIKYYYLIRYSLILRIISFFFHSFFRYIVLTINGGKEKTKVCPYMLFSLVSLLPIF